jgi:hypothetical protein
MNDDRCIETIPLLSHDTRRGLLNAWDGNGTREAPVTVDAPPMQPASAMNQYDAFVRTLTCGDDLVVRFTAACAVLNLLTYVCALPVERSSRAYGTYARVTKGPMTGPQPWAVQVERRMKWTLHRTYCNQSTGDAMLLYIVNAIETVNEHYVGRRFPHV